MSSRRNRLPSASSGAICIQNSIRRAVQCRATNPMAATSIPSQRQTWRVDSKGSVSNLTLSKEALPDLAPGHALVAVRAIGLNFADVFSCLGLYSATPKGSFIPGLEFSGEVLSIAPTSGTTPTPSHSTTPRQDGVDSHSSTPPAPLQVGDKVWGVTRFGAYASHIQLDARYLFKYPEGWSYEEAAAYPVQTITAAYALNHLGALRKGQAVLVHSAAGGVGLQAVKILSRYNAAVMGTVGSNSKLQQLREVAAACGLRAAEFVVRGSAGEFEERLEGFLEQRGREGFDLVLDSVQGQYFDPGFRQMGPCGRYVVFGAASLTPAPGTSLELSWRLLLPYNLVAALKLAIGYMFRPKVDPLQLPGENKSVLGFNLIWLYSKLELFQQIVDDLDALDLEPPVVGRCFDFDQLPEALEYLQSGQSFGKVVVRIAAP